MNPNLSTTYAAIQTARSRLASQAERGWQGSPLGRPAITVTRRWTGTLLILAGERLRGAPRGVQAPAT